MPRGGTKIQKKNKKQDGGVVHYAYARAKIQKNKNKMAAWCATHMREQKFKKNKVAVVWPVCAERETNKKVARASCKRRCR